MAISLSSAEKWRRSVSSSVFCDVTTSRHPDILLGVGDRSTSAEGSDWSLARGVSLFGRNRNIISFRELHSSFVLQYDHCLVLDLLVPQLRVTIAMGGMSEEAVQKLHLRHRTGVCRFLTDEVLLVPGNAAGFAECERTGGDQLQCSDRADYRLVSGVHVHGPRNHRIEQDRVRDRNLPVCGADYFLLPRHYT